MKKKIRDDLKMNDSLSEIINEGFEQLWFDRGDGIFIYYKKKDYGNNIKKKSITYYIYDSKKNILSKEKNISLKEAMYISKLYEAYY